MPGSSRDSIVGWMGDVLKVKVQAPPEKGKANQSVEKLLAELLGLAKSQVQVVNGKTSSRKVVEISSLDEEVVLLRIRAI